MRILLVLSVILQFNCCFSQKSTIEIVKTSDLPNRASFNTLNEKETSLTQRSTEKRQNRYKVDSTSLINKPENAYLFESMYPIYSQNRSRFTLYEFENGILHDSVRIESNAKASCKQTNDSTLTIETGFGIFGGLYFTIDVSDMNFKSNLNVDAYRDRIYKSQLTDTILSHRVDVSNSSETLLLDASIRDMKVEVMNGHLNFTSNTFYRSVDFDPYLSMDAYDVMNVNTLYYVGELDFTCKVIRK